MKNSLKYIKLYNTLQFDQKEYIAHFWKKKKKKFAENGSLFFYEKFAKYKKNTLQFDQKEYIAHFWKKKKKKKKKASRRWKLFFFFFFFSKNSPHIKILCSTFSKKKKKFPEDRSFFFFFYEKFDFMHSKSLRKLPAMTYEATKCQQTG